MSITVQDVINIHPFVPNPVLVSPYPIGIWKAQRTQVTDASAGVVRWTCSPAGLVQAYKYLWSCEDMSFLTSVVSAEIGIYYEVYTGEVVSRAGGAEILRFARTGLVSATITLGQLGGDFSAKWNPNFIHQPGGGNLNTYIIEAKNVNAQVYTMTAWGFFWNSEARRLASGPIRPGP